MTSNLPRRYRAAVSLNNMAVNLQSRGCSKQALETFEDAVFLMKMSSPVPSLAAECAEEEDVAVNLRVHRAVQRSSKPEGPRRQRNDTATDFSFFTLSSDDVNSFASAVSLADCDAAEIQNNRAILIRIDDYGTEGSRVPEIDSAIILHNYGVSCLCASRHVSAFSATRVSKRKESAVALQLRNSALNMLTLCQNLLAEGPAVRAVSAAPLDCIGDDPVLLQKVYFVAVISTGSMARVLSTYSGRQYVAQVDACRERFSALRGALLELDIDQLITDGDGAEKVGSRFASAA